MSEPSPTFRQVFDEHLPFVWSTLRRLGVPDADREDVAHEIFLSVFRHWSEYDQSRPLRPWLFVFAARGASDYRRRAHRRHEVLGNDEEHTAAPANGEPMEMREQRSLLHEALQSVDADRLPVLLLHELEELAIPEIAATLNIPLNTAYSRLRVARDELSAAVRKNSSQGLAMNDDFDPSVKALFAAETDAPPPAVVRDRLANGLAATLALPLPSPAAPIAPIATTVAGPVPKGLVTVGMAWVIAGAAFAAAGATGAGLVATRSTNAARSPAPIPSTFAPPDHVVIPPPIVALPLDAATPTEVDAGGNRPAPMHSASSASATDLGAERALLDQARDAMQAGDPATALRILDMHAARYPHGQMGEEREALAVDALVQAQKYTEARARAAKLRARSPNSLVLPAIDETLRSIP